MSKAPIDMMLDGVTWVECKGNLPAEDGMPYATHEGVLEIMGFKFRCYRLNTGQAMFNADDVEAFFREAMPS